MACLFLLIIGLFLLLELQQELCKTFRRFVGKMVLRAVIQVVSQSLEIVLVKAGRDRSPLQHLVELPQYFVRNIQHRMITGNVLFIPFGMITS